MPSLSQEEITRFLEETHLLHLATQPHQESTYPYVVPMWYTYIPNQQIFEVIGRPQNTWIEYIRKIPFVGYSVARETSPYMRVHGTGHAYIIDEGDIGDWWKPLAIRYLGEEAGTAYFEKTKDRPRVIVGIYIRNQESWSGGEWHRRYLP